MLNVINHSVQFSSAQSLSRVWLCDPMNRSTPGLPVHHRLPEFTQTQRPLSQWYHPAISSSVVPFSSCSQSLPASVFFSESTLCMRWPKYRSFSFSIIPSKEHPGLISFRKDWLDLLAVLGTLKSLLQHHSSKASIRRSAFISSRQISQNGQSTPESIWNTKQRVNLHWPNYVMRENFPCFYSKAIYFFQMSLDRNRFHNLKRKLI